MKPITIAIDGYAGCGKSTTAKRVAQELGYVFIDTGAMYRAVTLFFLRNDIPFDQVNPQMLEALDQIKVGFTLSPDYPFPLVTVNDEIVEGEIRNPEVSGNVSQVAVHKPVRQAMVAQQQEMGKAGGVVLDGRDIGTVVFPFAELKVFMRADMEVRANRRLAELESKGVEITLDEVIHNLQERDRIDTTREESPLKQAEDARVLDTTLLGIDEQVQQVLEWVREVQTARSAQ
ncbi:(d)CMP kinase [Pontibacter sp. G13]|uniref:(d)CMP kinase n=1 Tax=Pontibacter sp. G13 TaxID=3074898 RepID=UPI00288C361F|nr:(d)CMP kinase [Pontibacter sp. G13]WNJ17406.1 (d)CMP kinase [Pontibacter sp. G13]